MEFNVLNFALMTLFNTAICILLPRLVTLNWSQIFSSTAKEKINLEVGEIPSES